MRHRVIVCIVNKDPYYIINTIVCPAPLQIFMSVKDSFVNIPGNMIVCVMA